MFSNKRSQDAIRFAELAEILDAKSDLKKFDALSEEISETVEHLDQIPLCGNWEGRYKYFKGRLEQWDKFRKDYLIPAYAPLFKVEPASLKSCEWDDKVNGLSSDESLEYKHYKLALKAYERNHSRMRARIADIAYRSFHGRLASGKYMKRFDS